MLLDHLAPCLALQSAEFNTYHEFPPHTKTDSQSRGASGAMIKWCYLANILSKVPPSAGRVACAGLVNHRIPQLNGKALEAQNFFEAVNRCQFRTVQKKPLEIRIKAAFGEYGV